MKTGRRKDRETGSPGRSCWLVVWLVGAAKEY